MPCHIAKSDLPTKICPVCQRLMCQLMAQPLPKYIDRRNHMTARCNVYIKHQAATRPFVQVADETASPKAPSGASSNRCRWSATECRRHGSLGIDVIYLPDHISEKPEVREARIVVTDLDSFDSFSPAKTQIISIVVPWSACHSSPRLDD